MLVHHQLPCLSFKRIGRWMPVKATGNQKYVERSLETNETATFSHWILPCQIEASKPMLVFYPNTTSCKNWHATMQNICKPKSPESRMNFERFGESCSECKVSSSNTRTCNGESPELPYFMCFKKLWLHLPAHCPPFKQAIAPLVDCRCGKKKYVCLCNALVISGSRCKMKQQKQSQKQFPNLSFSDKHFIFRRG